MLSVSLDVSNCGETLAAFAEAAERFPQFRDALVDFLEAGQELFFLKDDRRSAAATGEFVVRLYPSDALIGLVAAFRARNPDFCFIEHCIPPTHANSTTGEGTAQC